MHSDPNIEEEGEESMDTSELNTIMEGQNEKDEKMIRKRECNAERQRRRRSRETDEEIGQRRMRDAIAHRTRRSMETEDETNQRRVTELTAIHGRRSRETDEDIEQRQVRDAVAHRTRRSMETQDEINQRRVTELTAIHGRRSRETDEDIEQRQVRDAVAHRTRRSMETEDETNERRITELTAINERRSKETYEEIEQRQVRDAIARRTRRSMENEDETNERRVTELTAIRGRRSRETNEEIEQRREIDAIAHRTRRETEDAAKERRIHDASAQQIRRSRETSVEATQRRARGAAADRSRRSSESEAELFLRREQDALAHMTARQRPSRNATYRIAATISVPQVHYFGLMSEECSSCHAKYFVGEAKKDHGTFNPCCNHGNVAINLFVNYPALLKSLFTGSHPKSENFLQYARNYNNSLALASLDCKLERVPGRGPYHFRMHGAVYYHVGPALPTNDAAHLSYGQLYILDTNQATQERKGNRANVNCEEDLMLELGEFMIQHNPYAQSYRMLYEVYQHEDSVAKKAQRPTMDIRMYFHVDRVHDKRRYNKPTANEVAVIYVGPDGDMPAPRTYSIHARSGRLDTIAIINQDPMLYPFFFLRKDEGWFPGIQKIFVDGRVSQKEYYSFLLSVRNQFNPLHWGRKLFQQFVVDSWAKTEQNRLKYIREHQQDIRAEKYQVLEDFMSDGETGLAGARIILPSTYTNSPRYMTQCYQDAMAIVSRFGKPDYFCTFTCNPKWKEIQENLYPGQKAEDRPDIVARVFCMKLNELMKDFKKGQVIGKTIAWIYVVEWQKRGLPHAHILITMTMEDKPSTIEKINQLVCAEIPDLNEAGVNQSLYDTVVANMIHLRCGPDAPCWDGKQCSKRFPKAFSDETVIVESGYPTYRRRNNGIEFIKDSQTYTNAHVVPYNKWIIQKYPSHCNFEVCAYIDACKYMYKYCYKGSDKAVIELRRERLEQEGLIDEIQEHLDARYVCAPEAVHRLFGFELQAKSHAVIHLMVHLPNFQSVAFKPGHEREALRNAKNTTLTAYFKLNAEWNGEGEVDPKTIFYYQIPEHFTWEKPGYYWKPQGRRTHNIGRIHTVSPKDAERYCMRLLLLNRKGATSYEDLYNVRNQQCENAQEAAKLLGLIDTADHFGRAMDEAATFRMPAGLRCMFVALMGFEGTANAEEEWIKHKKTMSEDYLYHGALSRIAEDPNRKMEAEFVAECLAYYDILDMCNLANVPWEQTVQPPCSERPNTLDTLAQEDYKTKGQEKYEQLTEEQRTLADSVLSGQEKLVYVDGPGGSGKTFVYECLYNKLRGDGIMVMCSAWTGIAANLLPDGRTVASLFKLSIDEDCRRSTMTPNSVDGRLLKTIEVFIIDECSMLAYWMLESINELLQDIHDGHLPKQQRRLFGGRTILMGGDFRQVLPIPSKASGLTPAQACLKHSPSFGQFRTFILTQNVRAATAGIEWKNSLLSVGDGTAEQDEEGNISLPLEIMSGGDIIEEIFEGTFDNAENLANRAILCPKNRDVDNINKEILQKMNGEEKVFLSIDSIGKDAQNDTLNLPTEFLNNLSPSGFPPHRLELKEGCVVILLRNLCVKKGLCNGTRLQVVAFGTTNVINCRFINGPRKGETIHIPRIELKTKQSIGFELRRRQFPLKLAFAMTINKSQGQSLEKVGIDLSEEAFSHGQLYVALSRCRTKEGVKVRTASGNNYTKNVVDKSVFD